MAAPTVVTDAAKYVANHLATLVGHSPWVDPREATSAIIFEWGKTTAYGNWTYWETAFPGEIYYHDITGLEKGTTYHFRIVGGAAGKRSYGDDRSFTTTIVSPPPVTLPFMHWIIERLKGIADWFYSIYLEINDWIPPFNWVAGWFWGLSYYFDKQAWNFYDFSLWLHDKAEKILTILSFGDIYYYFKNIFDYAIWAWNWVANSWNNVRDIVESWWGSKVPLIYGWIEEARQWASLQIDSLERLVYSILADVDELLAQIPDVSELTAWFSNWWGNILAELGTWWDNRLLEVQGLINSAFVIRESFWAGWQDIRGQVFEFFDDPLEWLLNRFTDWFLGPEV